MPIPKEGVGTWNDTWVFFKSIVYYAGNNLQSENLWKYTWLKLDNYRIMK